MTYTVCFEKKSWFSIYCMIRMPRRQCAAHNTKVHVTEHIKQCRHLHVSGLGPRNITPATRQNDVIHVVVVVHLSRMQLLTPQHRAIYS